MIFILLYFYSLYFLLEIITFEYSIFIYMPIYLYVLYWSATEDVNS